MSLVSKDCTQQLHGNTAPGWLFPLSTTQVEPPTLISANNWYNLPVDKRAPIGSVAIVDLVSDRFIAVVIDTVADVPRWRIDDRQESLWLLYRGMLGDPTATPRNTLIVSAPRNNPPTAAQLSGVGGDKAEIDCPLCVAFANPSEQGGGGPGGEPGTFLRSLARLHSLVGQSTRVTIGSDGVDQFDALFVSNG